MGDVKVKDHWWLITPEGKPFFSIGLNHTDPASLRYAENIDIWREKYGNSMQRWLSEGVRKNLLSWGFNSVGWVQEVVTRDERNHRHSRNYTFEGNVPFLDLLDKPISDWDLIIKRVFDVTFSLLGLIAFNMNFIIIMTMGTSVVDRKPTVTLIHCWSAPRSSRL